MGGAALAGLALTRKAGAQTATITDNDILNFALNLEFLEAQYYTLATAGVAISDPSIGSVTADGNGNAGGKLTAKANPAVSFQNPVLKAFATETAQDERNHIKFLQGQLGKNAVGMPNIDHQNSWNALAQAAGLPTPFDPFANETNFLLGAMALTDVGITAYHGAAPLLQSTANLTAASGIYATEAYHVGGIRTLIYAAGSQAQQASQQIAASRAKLSGVGDNGVGTVSSGTFAGASTIVDADANAIVYARNATQVLDVVYGGGAAGTGGLFFPNGLNASNPALR